MAQVDISNAQPMQQNDKRSNLQAQVQALMTPEAQSHENNQNEANNESMMLDMDELDDSMVFQNNGRQQASLFTPPGAPLRGEPAQTRQRARNERIGIGR